MFISERCNYRTHFRQIIYCNRFRVVVHHLLYIPQIFLLTFLIILVYDVKNVPWHLVTLPVFIGARQHAIIKRYQMLIFDCLPIVQMAIRPKGIADSWKICVVKQTHPSCFTPYVPHCHGIPIDINKNRHCGLTIENSKQ